VFEQLLAVEVDVNIERTGRRDKTVGGHCVGARADNQVLVDAVHRIGVASLAEAGDFAVSNPEIALLDAENGVDEDDVGVDVVERAFGLGGTGLHPHPVAHRLAAAEHRLVAVGGVVRLNLREEVRVAQPEPVALRRAEEAGVVLSGELAAHSSASR